MYVVTKLLSGFMLEGKLRHVW